MLETDIKIPARKQGCISSQAPSRERGIEMRRFLLTMESMDVSVHTP